MSEATRKATVREMPHVGDTVRLVGKRQTAKVTGYLMYVRGGVVLDAPLSHFRCWNKDDLEIIPRHAKSERRKK